jgi:chromosome segregation ATPase
LRLLEYKKKHDELQGKLDERQDKVGQLKDELVYIKREAEQSKIQQTESPYAKEIRLLENRLDKALIKYNEAQSVKRTYEEIVKRLQEDRLLFDNQINHFERTLKAKMLEVSELELLSKDANHAKELAKNELGRLEQQISEERKQREKELLQKRELVRIKREENAQLEKLPRPTLEGENDINAGGARPNESQKEQATDTEREKRRAEYEEVMMMIKDVMGVNHLSEVLQKFQQQRETHAHLTQLQQANENRLTELKDTRSEIKKAFEELRLNSEIKQTHSQRLIEELSEHLNSAEAERKDACIKHRKVEKILVDLSTGVHHLLERLEAVPSLTGKGDTSPIEDSDVLGLLERCQQKLEILYTTIKDKDMPVDQYDDRLLQFPQTMLPSNNIRVKLKPIEFEKNIDSGKSQKRDGRIGPDQ